MGRAPDGGAGHARSDRCPRDHHWRQGVVWLRQAANRPAKLHGGTVRRSGRSVRRLARSRGSAQKAFRVVFHQRSGPPEWRREPPPYRRLISVEYSPYRSSPCHYAGLFATANSNDRQGYAVSTACCGPIGAHKLHALSPRRASYRLVITKETTLVSPFYHR